MTERKVSKITVRPVVADRWAELADFFGPSGAYGHCWCTWWRTTAKDFSLGIQEGGNPNRDLLERLVAEGRVPGLLAYAEGSPVGWVSAGPRPDFGRLLRSRKLKPTGSDDDPEDGSVWSVVCFWIPRRHRGQGVATALLDAAVKWARAENALAVEGYPIANDGRKPSADLFTGTLGMFERAGFREVRRVGGRPVVRLAPLGAPAAAGCVPGLLPTRP